MSRWSRGTLTHTDLLETSEHFQYAQPLGSGRWLLLRVRAEDVNDCNAAVLAPDGTIVRTFHAGDGIAHVQVDEEGRVWLGYFDEGVYSRVLTGNSGLVCLDDCGRVEFRYSDLEGWPDDVPVIDDCYALNVCCEAGVWAYCYKSFSLVRIQNKKLAGVWPALPVNFAQAFAVKPNCGLFLGGRGRKPKREVHLVTFSPVKVETFCVTDNDGNPLDVVSGFGRGPRLYLRTEAALHFIEIEHVLP